MSALSENRDVRQRPDEGYRRWFVNEYFDLILWYESIRGELTGFQLCYDRHVDERAFTWQRDRRSNHYVSDRVDGRGIASMATAVLHGDAGSVPEDVLSRLNRERGELDAHLLQLITEKITEYNKQR